MFNDLKKYTDEPAIVKQIKSFQVTTFLA
jgi:hypothetical protein